MHYSAIKQSFVEISAKLKRRLRRP